MCGRRTCVFVNHEIFVAGSVVRGMLVACMATIFRTGARVHGCEDDRKVCAIRSVWPMIVAEWGLYGCRLDAAFSDVGKPEKKYTLMTLV